MKTLKAFSTAALAVSFLIAPLAAQTAPPAQASEAAQTVSSNAPPPQAQQSAQERATEVQRLQDEQRKLLEAQRKQAEVERYEMEGIVKTYSLKYVNANELMRAAKFYVYDWTASGNILTVKIARKFIPDFEALLKKLDVEKRNIQFQVYTVIASKEAPTDRFKSNFVAETKDLGNAELRRVLDEMKGLWNFKYYWVENPSFLTVKDGSEGNSSKLVSSLDFEMRLRNVELRGEESGKRIIAVGAISLFQTLNTVRQTLIDTSDITFKEKGYLVVGVSGLQWGPGGALILIISADVK